MAILWVVSHFSVKWRENTFIWYVYYLLTALIFKINESTCKEIGSCFLKRKRIQLIFLSLALKQRKWHTVLRNKFDNFKPIALFLRIYTYKDLIRNVRKGHLTLISFSVTFFFTSFTSRQEHAFYKLPSHLPSIILKLKAFSVASSL